VQNSFLIKLAGGCGRFISLSSLSFSKMTGWDYFLQFPLFIVIFLVVIISKGLFLFFNLLSFSHFSGILRAMDLTNNKCLLYVLYFFVPIIIMHK
jgi:hypothetical protein